MAPREEHFWTRLCEALGAPDLATDPAFADAKARQANREVLLPRLEEIFRRKDAASWLRELQAAGVPAAR